MMSRFSLFFLVLLLCALSFGCQSKKVKPVTYFNAAEAAYRAGQYKDAHDQYTEFLRQNPDPQLARLAERRIHAIERELECVMGQKSGPRPDYVNIDEDGGEKPARTSRILNKSEHDVRMPAYE